MEAVSTVDTTKAVLDHHLKALMARNLNDIVSDYTSASVIFTQQGVFKGTDMARAFFTEALKILSPEVMPTFKIDKAEYDGEFVYAVWSAGQTIPMASDTFCVRDGKIVLQTVTLFMGK